MIELDNLRLLESTKNNIDKKSINLCRIGGRVERLLAEEGRPIGDLSVNDGCRIRFCGSEEGEARRWRLYGREIKGGA